MLLLLTLTDGLIMGHNFHYQDFPSRIPPPQDRPRASLKGTA
jgi:hypothetical protein